MTKRCRYCRRGLAKNSYLLLTKRGEVLGYYCKDEVACFNRLLDQRDQLLRIGQHMSNAFYNIGQRSQELVPGDNAFFNRMRSLWESGKVIVDL